MFNKMNMSPTTMAILVQLAGDPMKEFYQREIAREAKVSLGSANQLLKELVDSEIIILEKRGKMLFYRVNLSNPVARHFKILFNVIQLADLIKDLRDLCKRIVLFGSCAEGMDVRESDMDLFVLAQKNNLILQTINKYERKINRRISPIILSPTEWVRLRRRDKPLYDNISKGLVLWQTE